jgi:hypothetical protein
VRLKLGPLWRAVCPSVYVNALHLHRESADIVVLDLFYLAFPVDRWAVKGLIAFVYLMETAQTFIVTNDYFHTYTTGFADIQWLDRTQTEWLAVPVFTAIG